LWLTSAHSDLRTEARFIFSKHQFACWDVLGDRMLDGYPATLRRIGLA